MTAQAFPAVPGVVRFGQDLAPSRMAGAWAGLLTAGPFTLPAFPLMSTRASWCSPVPCDIDPRPVSLPPRRIAGAGGLPGSTLSSR